MYLRRQLAVRCGAQPATALVYVARRRGEGQPRPGYIELVVDAARDWQLHKPGKQWMAGKTFDTFAPIGPALVSADEVPVLHDLGLEPGRAVGVPFRLAAVRQDHPHPELIGPDLSEVRVDAAVAERVGDPAGTVLLHRTKICATSDCPRTVAGLPARDCLVTRA